MKAKLVTLCSAALLIAFVGGCDPEDLPSDVAKMLQQGGSDVGAMIQNQFQFQNQLHDGSGDGTGTMNQYQYQYQHELASGQGLGGANGDQDRDRDRDRLQDGSCGG